MHEFLTYLCISRDRETTLWQNAVPTKLLVFTEASQTLSSLPKRLINLHIKLITDVISPTSHRFSNTIKRIFGYLLLSKLRQKIIRIQLTHYKLFICKPTRPIFWHNVYSPDLIDKTSTSFHNEHFVLCFVTFCFTWQFGSQIGD